MNPEMPRPPREEIEVRLSALLLGELSAEEAAALRELIARDAQLAELHGRLKRAVDLVREAAAPGPEPAAAPVKPLKLSDTRRQKLLAHFKTVAPKEFISPPRRRDWSWMVPLGAVAAVVVLLAAITIPNYTTARESAMANSVFNNLRVLEGAKDQWALENKKTGDDVVTLGDIKDYLKGGEVRPVLGEHYILGKVSDPVTAEVDASRAKKTFGDLATRQPGERFMVSGQPTRGEMERLVAAGGLTYLDKNGRTTADAQSAGAASAPMLRYSSAQTKEELLSAAKPPAPGENRPAPGQVFQKGVAARSMPSTGEKKREVESLDLRRSAAASRPEIVLPPSIAPNDGAKAQFEAPPVQQDHGGREFPLSSLLATTTTGGRGGVFDGGGGGGLGGGGGGGYVPVADAQADPNARNARRSSDFFANPEWAGVLESPGSSSGGLSNQFVSRYAFALQPPGVNGDATALGLQPGKPSLPNEPPANIEAKFAESSQSDNKALGFLWYDRGLERGRQIGLQGGAAPSIPNQPSKAKPGIRDTDAGVSAMDDNQNLASVVMTPDSRALREKSIVAGVAGAPRTVTATTAPGSALELNRLDGIDQLARKRDGSVDLYAGQVPLLGDTPGLGRLYRANPDAKPAAEEARSKVERPVTPQTEGRGLTKLSAGKAGGIVAQDTEPNGRLDQRAERLGEEVIPLGVDAARATDAARKPIVRDAAASEDAVRRRLPAIVLPSATTDTTAGLPIVITGSEVRGYSPDSRIEPEQLRQLHSARGEGEKDYSGLERQLKELKSLPRPELRKAFSKSVSDPTLTDLTRQLALAEKDLASRTPTYGPATPDVNRLADQVQVLSKKIDDRIDGVMTALETQSETAKTTVNLQNEAVEVAQKKDNDQPAQSRLVSPAAEPQPEVQTHDNAFSTFALNVSDVSFKLAGASLEKGVMPEPATVRSEEFINALDYGDPEPPTGVPIAFAWERTRYPFAHNRDLLRFSVKTAAEGRQPGRPLNLVLLLDNSGSMERADRVQIIHEALRVLATQLQAQDKLSVVTFARTARLWADGVPGNQAGALAEQIGSLTPQGGTNLGDAMDLAYQTALRHYLANGVNRIVLLTDGAANLGNVNPDALKQKVEAHRKQGLALDCFGIGWEGYNDDLLEILSRNGDGRYGFINTPEEAASDFAGQLAGALRVAASDVKVQVEFNPARVTAYRQIGYAKHQLTKEQFRDNTVDAAEIGAAESGNALYVAEVNPRGEGPLAIVRVRYKVPGTADYREHEWAVPYAGNAVSLEQASPGMRLAATASAFSEWLVSSPYAAEITPDRLLGYLGGVQETYGADARPKELEWMIRQAKSISGK